MLLLLKRLFLFILEMPIFNEIEILTEYVSNKNEIITILDDLKTIIINSNTSLEGNSFYIHQTLNIYDCLYKKQANLFWSGKQAKRKICEIGFNAGHSTMLMLIGREKTPLDFTIFDIGHHKYTNPCVNYIKTKFPHVNFEYIEGDSTITMEKWIDENRSSIGSYDVVHVDGGHSEYCISNDMRNSDILVKINGILIIDDTNNEHINKYVDSYISSGKYKELDVIPTEGYQHRIIQKIK